VLFDARWAQTFSVGLWRNPIPPPNRAQYRGIVEGMNMKFHRDGAGATVTVVSQDGNDRPRLSLNVNGKTDASLGLDKATQVLLGHIPVLLRSEAREALVVGLGSGMTCSALARHSSIQTIDAVEILPEVVEAARLFGPHNDQVLDNPKLRVVIEDAKSFLKIGNKKYDVIVSEPSNPWMAGVAGVFTVEYYQSCQARLKEDGIMAQWVQMYETSDAILNLVMRTFASVFPYTSIWRPASGDLILIGTVNPIKVDLAALERRFNEPSVNADLERIEITRLPVLLAREMVSQQNGVFTVPPEGPIHSDLFPVLEYMAQEAFFAQPFLGRWGRFDENFLTRPSTLLGQYLKDNKLTEADYRAFGRFFLDYRLPDSELVRSIVLRWHNERPEATLPMELMSQASDRVPTAEVEALRLRPMADLLMKRAEKDPEPLRMYESYLMQMYRAHRSVFYLPSTDHLQIVVQRLLEVHSANQRVYKMHLAELAWDRGDDEAFFQLAQSGFDPDITKSGRITFTTDPEAPRYVLFRMAETLWRAGKLKDAAILCQQAHAQNYTGSDGLLDMACRKIEAYVNLRGNRGGSTARESSRIP
jgi:spermidine synthase